MVYSILKLMFILCSWREGTRFFCQLLRIYRHVHKFSHRSATIHTHTWLTFIILTTTVKLVAQSDKNVAMSVIDFLLSQNIV